MAPIIHKTLTLYFHPISQPSRAIHVALLLGKVEFVPVVIDIMAEEQKGAEYTAINPAQQVPAIKDGEFILFESHAIMRYLVLTRPSLKMLYPQDPRQRALVDCYLYWHHSGTRQLIAFVIDFFFKPTFNKIEAPPNRAERQQVVDDQLAFIETQFLGGEKKYKYIANQPNLTIADLSCHAEIISLLFVNYDFSKYPNVQAWLENISSFPEVKAAYQVHNDLIKQFNPQLNDFNQRII